ncbi:MAG: anthranilate phosphoribosyltransferase [Candidatus Omnitrophica bacterium]|nr:anthranilate phosphoribosyltransferase [Candidatus Omnitrophota bacterium]
MIEEAIAKLTKKEDLDPALMRQVMEEIMTGKADTQLIVSFLNASNEKGQSVDELIAAAEVMRAHVTRISVKEGTVLDTCGTGGDKKGTFNISTVVAFVAAAAGITVAKHGNRSVSSICGSADILEALGVNINLGKERIEECLERAGIAFLFAPNLHPAMKYAMPARKQIGKRTMFNILGPLTNPAGATHQLLGVFDAYWTKVLAEVLLGLGTKHALVVHGQDGLDEITTTSKTYIAEVKAGKVSVYQIAPEDFGIPRSRPQDLSGGDAGACAGIFLDILKGKAGPKRDIVVLNAAAAIYAADKAGSIKEGIKLAARCIDSGEALKKFEIFKSCSNQPWPK